MALFSHQTADHLPVSYPVSQHPFFSPSHLLLHYPWVLHRTLSSPTICTNKSVFPPGQQRVKMVAWSFWTVSAIILSLLPPPDRTTTLQPQGLHFGRRSLAEEFLQEPRKVYTGPKICFIFKSTRQEVGRLSECHFVFLYMITRKKEACVRLSGLICSNILVTIATYCRLIYFFLWRNPLPQARAPCRSLGRIAFPLSDQLQ